MTVNEHKTLETSRSKVIFRWNDSPDFTMKTRDLTRKPICSSPVFFWGWTVTAAKWGTDVHLPKVGAADIMFLSEMVVFWIWGVLQVHLFTYLQNNLNGDQLSVHTWYIPAHVYSVYRMDSPTCRPQWNDQPGGSGWGGCILRTCHGWQPFQRVIFHSVSLNICKTCLS